MLPQRILSKNPNPTKQCEILEGDNWKSTRSGRDSIGLEKEAQKWYLWRNRMKQKTRYERNAVAGNGERERRFHTVKKSVNEKKRDER